MKKKLNLLFFFLLSYTMNSYSQSVGVCFYKYNDRPVDTVALKAMIVKARDLMTNCDTSACVSTKLHFIASVYYALDYPKDTIAYYLDEAKRVNPVYFCRLVEEETHIIGQSKVLAGKGIKYFANSFSPEWWEAFNKDCEKYKLEKKAAKQEEIVIKNAAYLNALKSIMLSDQKYRENMESFFLQAKLDEDNRLKLDNLYNLYGFPSIEQTSEEGSNIAWFVLQHSTDCEWTKKWLTRFLEAYQKEECKSSWLDTTFKRFFNPQNGYCTKKDSKDAQEFITKLVQDFPSDYARIFGYGDF